MGYNENLALYKAEKDKKDSVRKEIAELNYTYKDELTTGAETPSTWDSYCGQPSAIEGEISVFTDLERTQCESGKKADLRNIYESGPLSKEEILQVGALLSGERANMRKELGFTRELEKNLIDFHREQAIQYVNEYATKLSFIKGGLRYKDISRIRKARELAKSYKGDNVDYSKAPGDRGYSPVLDEVLRLISG
tara:strand:+ start:858 stop:1439 length:582 start_codon:yes stop_codon:yes gene_type:complete